MRKTIWGNTIIKNEGRFLWFAVNSVIGYLDKLLIWDTGSTDSTLKIIKELQKRYPEKILFKEVGEVDKDGFTKMRQKMLEETKGDWLFVLDGDEVWWEKSIKKIVEIINSQGDKIEMIVTPFYSVIGDIYHYQEEKAGQYHLAGKVGHLNIRAINRKIPGLHIDKPYGQEGYFDDENKPIQNRNPKKILFLDRPYLHFSNIQRSDFKSGDRLVMQRSGKVRYEIGLKFSENFKFPEVFYQEYPSYLADPWRKMSASYAIRAFLETPLRKIKRRLK